MCRYMCVRYMRSLGSACRIAANCFPLRNFATFALSYFFSPSPFLQHSHEDARWRGHVSASAWATWRASLLTLAHIYAYQKVTDGNPSRAVKPLNQSRVDVYDANLNIRANLDRAAWVKCHGNCVSLRLFLTIVKVQTIVLTCRSRKGA